MDPAVSLQLFKSQYDIRFPGLDQRGWNMASIADMGYNASASLRHAVYLRHFDVVTGMECHIADYPAGKQRALPADAYNQ
jgi:hypothetical protein